MGKSRSKKKLRRHTSSKVVFSRNSLQEWCGQVLHWHIAIISLLSLAVYLGALANGFVWDDRWQVLSNPFLLDFNALPKIFTTGVWEFLSPDRGGNYYRPLMMFVYMLNYHLFGFSSLAFHFVNILLHVSVTILVYLIIFRLSKQANFALIGSLLFAVHPVHTEAVVWIASLPELGMAFFYLLSLYLYFKVRMNAKRNVLSLKIFSVASFFIALLFKEMALTLPIILIVYEYFYIKTSLKESLRHSAAYMGAVAFYFVLRIHALGGVAPQERFHLTLYENVLSVISFIGQYWWKLMFPIHLNAWYEFKPSQSLFEWGVVAAFFTIVFLIVLMFRFWKAQKIEWFAIAWVFITLLPVLYLNKVGLNAFTERYLYLPSVGFCWLVAYMLNGIIVAISNRIHMKQPLFVTLCCASVFIIPFSYLTVTRIPAWKDEISIYSDILAHSPSAYKIRDSLGLVYLEKDMIDNAIEQFGIVFQTQPNFSETHNNLGAALMSKGDFDSAIKEFHEAIRLKPEYVGAHSNLALAYEKKEFFDDAIEEYRKTIQLDPRNIQAHNNLGVLYLKKNSLNDAQREFQEILRLNPNSVDAYLNLGIVFYNQGLYTDALVQFKEVLRLDPHSTKAEENIRFTNDRLSGK